MDGNKSPISRPTVDVWRRSDVQKQRRKNFQRHFKFRQASRSRLGADNDWQHDYWLSRHNVVIELSRPTAAIGRGSHPQQPPYVWAQPELGHWRWCRRWQKMAVTPPDGFDPNPKNVGGNEFYNA